MTSNEVLKKALQIAVAHMGDTRAEVRVTSAGYKLVMTSVYERDEKGDELVLREELYLEMHVALQKFAQCIRDEYEGA